MKLETDNSNVKYLISIAFIIGVMPLIVFGKKISLEGVLAGYWSRKLDFFSYYKMFFLLASTSLALITFAVYLFQKQKIKKTYYYILIEIYGILIILSTIYSAYPDVALWGFPDRYEGMFTLLSYLLLMFFVINLVEYKKDLKFLLGILFVSASIISIIGLFQYFGFDIFATLFGKELILPDNLTQFSNEISVRVDYIYSTLYNPNYMGSYTGMLLSLSVALYILVKGNRNKLIVGCFSLLIFSNWLGCLSRAGIVGGILAISLLFLLLSKDKLIENKRPIIILGIGFIVIFTLMNYAGNGRLVKEFVSFKGEVKKDARKLKDVEINKDKLSLITQTDQLQIKLIAEDKLKFFNKDNELITYKLSEKSKKIKFKENKYQDYKFKLNKKNDILNFEYGGKKAEFKLVTSNEKEFLLLGYMGRGCKTDEVEKCGFTNHEGFATNRGYIWSRSLPLLKDTVFLGYGPDLYALYFPQFDAVGKLMNFGTTRILVDKPHNMYLQIAINTGVISLLVTLLMFGKYIVSSIKLYWKRELNNFYSKVGIGIFVAVVAYLITGLFNDSVISVAPVFWALFGIGISVNMKLKEDLA